MPEDAFYIIENQNLKFKTKHELALELVDDAIAKGVSFSDIVFDGWYFCNWFVADLERHNLTWISEAQVARSVCFHGGKWVRVDELVKLISASKFKREITVPNSRGKQRTFFLYNFVGKVGGLEGKKLIAVAKGKWDDDSKDVHVFITNHLASGHFSAVSGAFSMACC